MTTATATHTASSSKLLIGAAWLLVVLPAAWGLNYTVRNALKIFTAQTQQAPAK